MNSSSETVRVELADASTDRGYDIRIGRALVQKAAQLCTEICNVQHAIVITDDQVSELYARRIHDQFVTAGVVSHLFTVPAGERSKSIDVATRLWQDVLDSNATRKSTIVAVGGGVVGDLAGFIAASFARGLGFIQIPTSLLAQVDSSVGGKVAINLPGAKNMVGFFWQPNLVIADLDVLDTLPEREYAAGLAEVVKYGVIADGALFEQLEANTTAILAKDKPALANVIARCCQIKADVVQEDERETTGRRAILNYGHTIGHALESVCGYGELLHGEAIAIGMHGAAKMAAQRGLIDTDFVRRQSALLHAFHLPTAAPDVDFSKVWTSITKDKKADSSGVRFILPTQIGSVKMVDAVGQEEVLAALRE